VSERVTSLVRGLAVLKAFAATNPQLTLSEVANKTALPRATTRRMLLTLIDEGLVRQNEGVFELTPRILQLGFAYLSGLTLTEVATPLLEELSASVGESSSVAILDETEMVYVARVRARRIMEMSIGLGSRLPAYQTSLGRAILSRLEDDDIAEIYKASDKSMETQYTVGSLEALMTKIREARSKGYVIVDQEVVIGVRSIATHLQNGRGETLAALNLSTQPHVTALDTLEAVYAPRLLETANQISDALIAHGRRDLGTGLS